VRFLLKGMGGENTDGMRTDDRKGDNDRQETGTGRIGGRACRPQPVGGMHTTGGI